jgi:molecular chaperone GrpE
MANLRGCRCFSEKVEEKKEEPAAAAAAEEPAAEAEAEAEAEAVPEKSETELLLDQIEELKTEKAQLKDRWMRALAETENVRTIAARDVKNSRQFAISSFAKSLLDVPDNLSRALESAEKAEDKSKDLEVLLQGVQMTDTLLTKAFESNQLIQYGAVGDEFDPNVHEALFNYADTTGQMEPGTVGQILKCGYSLNDRNIRICQVGVVQKA